MDGEISSVNLKKIEDFSACLEPKISTSYLFSGFVVTIFHLRNFICQLNFLSCLS